MKIEEFNKTRFGGNMFARYKNDVWFIVSVDFSECLFGLVPHKREYPADEWNWVRCENVELIKDNKL